MNLGSLDQWRNYFRTANSDIFDIINHAIMVAASDCPKEFRLRRDEIAQKLFSCRFTHCMGCDKIELSVSVDDNEKGDGGCKNCFDRDDGAEFEYEAGASKESKVNSSGNDHGEMNMNQVSNYSFEEAEALTNEIEEESQYHEEVLRIKEVMLNFEEESDKVLFESLRRLQLMELTVDLLKVTEIGKAVNPLRKHGSRDIRQLTRTLIDGWKEMVDEWVKATTPIAVGSEGTPDSINPSVIDEEEGLPSPPMDEAFFAAQTGSMELSQFFDGMDDDLNPQQSREFIKNRDNGRRPSLDSQNMAKRKHQASNKANIIGKDSKNQQTKKNGTFVRLNKPVDADSGPGRPPKSSVQKKSNIEPKMQPKIVKTAVQKRHQIQQDKFKCSDDAAVQVKLEATKRKLQERYQQAENAKRQRTVQVMELHDLPKKAVCHRNPHVKPGNQKRQWAHGRR
ncbi:PREDICTED: probable mediator of RNA polymerase II transcription subunit 26b isoform X1 [Lupinus angustifolius]|uniref:probable mediator of RNA polymerase II transcription subunit 26b isoform X1 n=1 Tax=Lupinus angustifolius TaxID=3871 RepID=UPI00092EDB65|nr:PREDICTED: probable mediator of RNA polymerase II transcription subunit 26b isoform X1 [Lupinus angustifolius]